HRVSPVAWHLQRVSVDGHRSRGHGAEDPGSGLGPGGADRHRLPGHPGLGVPVRRGAAMTLDSKAPSGALADKWDRHKFEVRLVNPANKRKFTLIVVGTGLA